MVTFGNGVYIHHYISPIIQWLNGAATVPVLWQKFQAIGIIMMLKKLYVAGCSNVARPTFQMRQTEQNTAPNLRYILTELHTHCGIVYVVVAWQVQHRKTFANNNWSFVKESSKLQYLSWLL